MKSKIRVTGFLLLFFAFIITGVMSCAAHDTQTVMIPSDKQITVFNPAISSNFAERAPLAPRTGTLEGKTIYLVDLQWGGPEAGYSVFEEMKQWFSKNMPSVKVEVRRSKGGWMGDDPDLREEIAAKGGGAVIGIGG